jgi:hypothetical protein
MVSALHQPRAQAEPSLEPSAARAATSTLSMAPQLEPHAEVGAGSTENMCRVVLGGSPTLDEPATPPGIDSLGGGRRAAAGSRKTAWKDYMLAPLVPAWSLRLKANSTFEMNGANRWVVAPAPLLAPDVAESGGGYGKFGFSVAAPAGRTTVLAPGAWTALGDAGARSALLPTPIMSLRAATADASDAGLLPTQLVAPPSAAGAAAGAAPLPLPKSQ